MTPAARERMRARHENPQFSRAIKRGLSKYMTALWSDDDRAAERKKQIEAGKRRSRASQPGESAHV